ncbi:MAG: biotin transporter BioY [Halobacteriaceae archaeon]
MGVDVDTDEVALVGEETTTNLARAAVFAAITAATAPVNITHPLAPNIPITLQTFWVYLSGIVLGPVYAGLSFVLYVVAGAVGLPVFAGGSGGIGVLFGNTGGYIVGFVVAAVAIGFVTHGTDGLRPLSRVGVGRLVLALVVGTAAIYAFGVAGLMLNVDLGLATAIQTGVLPFLPVAAIKIAGAIAVARGDAIPWDEIVAR